MASRKGTLLERNVEQLLTLVGLKPELNKIYNGYEIDIFMTSSRALKSSEMESISGTPETPRFLSVLSGQVLNPPGD